MYNFQPVLKEERIYRLQDFLSRNGEEGACTGENKLVWNGAIKYPSSSMKHDKSMAYKVRPLNFTSIDDLKYPRSLHGKPTPCFKLLPSSASFLFYSIHFT